jgi:hypothetical protein
MRKLYVFFLGVMGITWSSTQAQISLTTPTGPYNQDFNTLVASGSTPSSTLPTGWLITETGTGAAADNMYIPGNGSGTGGNTYSFGTGTNTDRALGILQSNTVLPTMGVFFTNNTNASIATITVTYTGEQWRLGTRGRYDFLEFQYSTNATSLSTGTWTDVNELDFQTPDTTISVGARDGNASGFRQTITFTITGLSIPNGSTFYFRWSDFPASGADDGLAIDDFSITYTTSGGSGDVTPPSLTTLSPLNAATNVSQSPTLQLTFNETVQKGTGNIFIKLLSDNSTVQTIAVTDAAVTINNTIATISINTLSANTGYYIEVDAGAFEDLAANDYAGFTGNGTWSFTTGNIINNYNFNTCSSALTDGFTQFSVSGAQVWGCTTFGRNGSNGVQMNGFAGGPVNNEDWLISPALNLSAANGFTVPLLSFYSRIAFNGPAPQLLVSTDYTSGDPTTATWTVIDGRFPPMFADVWTLSDSINLGAFMQTNVHFAFRYTSGVTSGARRFTLDDINISNSATPPLPSLTTDTALVDFYQKDFGSPSAPKTFSFWANDITGNLTLTAPTGFELSKDNSTYGASISYTPAETINQFKMVFVRLNPLSANQGYTGLLNFSGGGISEQKVSVKGNSYPLGGTLNIVNWNLEWFGAAGLGPTDENLQQANAKTTMEYLDADIFAMAEIVDETRFASLVGSLAGGYSYVLGDFCSSGSTPAACASAQKLAFVYKTSVVSNVTARALLKTSPTANTNWSNGRFPYLVNATVTKNGITRNINFIILHAKAFDGVADYNQRKGGADELKDTLDAQFSNTNVVILGDFNDDLDSTIVTSGISPRLTPFDTIVKDSTDADSYKSLTLPLSLLGLHSTFNNGDVIDHVVVSNEMASGYIGLSASLHEDVGTLAGIPDFSATTSDHYPVMTRFDLNDVLPVTLVSFQAIRQNNTVQVKWTTTREMNSATYIVERSGNGRQFAAIGTVPAAGQSNRTITYQFTDTKPLAGNNFYRLKQVDQDGKTTLSKIAWVAFDANSHFTFGPNPAHDHITISLHNTLQPVTVQLLDINGKVLHQKTSGSATAVFSLPVHGLAKGIYLLKLTSAHGIETAKVMVE